MIRSKLKYLLIIGVLISGCEGDNTKVTNIQNQWSGLNPTSIPLSVRIKEEQKGNLITNPSFELGKHYTLDSTKLSFNLPGWKKVGDNVIWTDIENRNEFDKNDASSGNHAIKITRDQSDETEILGEGIMSDYIRVIPGNYLLSLDVRLEHIKSNLNRLVSGIYDAVNVRIFCYDKNKVMIKNVSYHPLYNKEIDNSFKGFGFSNHDKIERFGWARVFGRSGNFPFEEGNLPEDTRYIKIFAGLKGEGKMWVDKFDFRYSSKNFTLLEKLEPYFDTTMEKSRYLIPEPQKSGYYKRIPLILTDESHRQLLPRILMPVNANGELERIIKLFNSDILEISIQGENNLPLLEDFDPEDLEIRSLIFSIGNNSLSNQFAEQLPFEEIQDLDQAYFIKRLDQISNVIFIGYSDLEGLQHAFHTLDQLMEFKENIYHHYDIVDYPDYLQRGVIIQLDDNTPGPDSLSRAFRSLNHLGINTWVIESKPLELVTNNLLKGVGPWLRSDFTNTTFPYIRKGLSLERLKLPDFPMDAGYSDQEKLASYEKTILNSAKDLYEEIKKLNSFNTDLLIFSDRTLWESMNFSPAGAVLLDNENFNKFMFYRNLFSRAFSNNNLSELPESYLIPFYQGISRKENVYYDIYSDAIADSSVGGWFTTVLWSGTVKNTNLIDAMDLYGIRGTPELSLLDHSLTYQTASRYYGNYYSLYPGKALTGVIFKPYDTRIIGIDPEDFNYEALLKVNDFSEITRIRVATAVDYFWNTSLYDPAISLWKILTYSYGKEIAREIVYFNDLYFKLLSISLNMELNGYNQKHEKQASELIIELNSRWDKLKILLESEYEFLNDLSDLKNSIISRYYQAQKNSLDKEPIQE